MALKLTRTASETLNDIILHTLQEHGLEKAEALEELILNQLRQLPLSLLSKPQGESAELLIVNSAYAIIYKHVEQDQVVLCIVHPSRLPASINS